MGSEDLNAMETRNIYGARLDAPIRNAAGPPPLRFGGEPRRPAEHGGAAPTGAEP